LLTVALGSSDGDSEQDEDEDGFMAAKRRKQNRMQEEQAPTPPPAMSSSESDDDIPLNELKNKQTEEAEAASRLKQQALADLRRKLSGARYHKDTVVLVFDVSVGLNQSM